MIKSGDSRAVLPSGVGLSPEGQSRFLGYVMVVTGRILTVVGTILVFGTAPNPLPAIGRVVVGGFVIVGSIKLSRRGRRHVVRTISAEITTIADGEPFVLYLRSFIDDDTLKKHGHGVDFWRPTIRASQRTEEEQLRAAVRPFGELIAVGRPGEPLPELGAKRLYLPKEPPDAWRPIVIQMMKSAHLVLLNVGPGESLKWEVEQVVENVRPERLVLIVPTNSTEYSKFKEESESLFPEPLPGYPSGARKEYYSAAIRGAIYFADDWTSDFVRFDGLKSPGNYRRLVESHFVYGLRPVYDKLSVAWPGLWRRYPITRGQLPGLYIALAMLPLIVFLGWHVIGDLIQLFKLMFNPPSVNDLGR
jgi:hypothetical protein